MNLDHGGHSFFAPLDTEKEIRRKGEFLCDLSHLKFMTAHGPDAVSFLNGQLTNDIEKVSNSVSQLSGYCTPKGRLLCIFRIHRNDERLVLQANKNVLPNTVERLQRFVLRAKLELKFEDSISSFGIVGRESSKVLAAVAGGLPEDREGCLAVPGLTLVCHSTASTPRYQVVGPPSALIDLWRQLSTNIPNTGSWAWTSLDIEQGLPAILTQTSEQFVPQNVNMDLINAVSFHKGCYPGQEIVARMHYLGKLKTRMIRAEVDGGASPKPGDKLYTSASEQSIGMLVDSAPANHGYHILTTVRLDQLDSGDLRIHGSSGQLVVPKVLPYLLESPDQKQA